MKRIFWILSLNVCVSCGQPVTFSGNSETVREMRIKTSQKYPAREEINQIYKYNFKTENYSQKVTLSAKPPLKASFYQNNRSFISDEFTQGFSGDQVTENFSTKAPDKLDLLIVVDDSSSMRPYQNKLAPQLAPLLSHISNTDWQIMVISTTPIRRASREPGRFVEIYGCPRRNPLDTSDQSVITKKQFEEDPIKSAKRFEWKVSIGDDSGDPIERGLYASIQGLTGECGDPTKPWVRPGSHRAVLILTDEENCGSDPDQNCDDKPDSDPYYFLNNVQKGTQFFALLHDNEKYSDTCTDEGYLRKPDDYRTVIALTDGMEGNICSTDYGTTLTEISKNIHQINKVQYPLKSGAASAGAEVFIDGKLQNIPFSIENDMLTFLAPLPASVEKISVSYKVNVTPRFRIFNLNENLDPSSISVFINNQVILRDAYRISRIQMVNSGRQISQLEFLKQPPDLSRIKVVGRDLREILPKKFLLGKNLPPNVLVSSIEVSLNGAREMSYNVDPSAGELLFERAPPDGTEIVLKYETEDSRKTDYLISTIDNLQISNHRVYDETTNDDIPAKFEGGILNIPSQYVRHGRSLILSYSGFLPQRDLRISLPNVPIEKSLILNPLQTTPSACLDEMRIEGSSLIFPCGGEQFGQMTVEYKYLSDTIERYQLPKIPEPSDVVVVFVDDRETPYFRVEGDQVLLSKKYLKSDSRVEAIIESIIYY